MDFDHFSHRIERHILRICHEMTAVIYTKQPLIIQLTVNCWFGARWFGFLGSYQKDCYH